MATCCFRSCDKGGLVNDTTGKVDVRGFQVEPDETEELKAKWDENGDAVFHHECWRHLQTLQRDGKLRELEDKLVKEASKTAEFHDPKDWLKAEARRIVQMIRDANYCIAFTGAGISTAAGIGDYRGKDGKWTKNDKIKAYGAKGGSKTSKGGSKTLKGGHYENLRPTYAHEALVKLTEMGLLKYLISQNTDGLHRLSGIPAAKISELHGNAYTEKCEKCERRYDLTKSYRALSKWPESVPLKKCERCRINHRTGRRCQAKDCDGYLMNTIINFGDYLEEPVLDSAKTNARKADLILCLGTTLMVSPANSLVEMGKQPIRLIICNRQTTPYDDYCSERDSKGIPVGARIFGDCDKLMREVMLGILGKDGLDDWEDGRENRLREYDKKRQD